MEKVNELILRLLTSLYKDFPEAKEVDVSKNELLEEKKYLGLLSFLSEEGYIRAYGNYPIFKVSLTGKGYKFIHNFLQRTNNHKEPLIIYQEV